MSTVQQIEKALYELPVNERWSLLHKFQDELWSEWDHQIEDDLTSGRLDAILAEAREEMTSGKTRALDEVINHN